MITIELGGVLKERFGPSFELDAGSPQEAVTALCAMVEDFHSWIRHNNFHVWLDGEPQADTANIEMEAPKGTKMFLELAVEGAGGNNGILSVIAGVALIIVGFYMPAAWGAAAQMLAIGFGAALAATGVAQMMMPTGKTDAADQDGNKASYGFGGAVTTTEQGNIVPVGYGELLQGGFVVTYHIRSEQI